jgi:hypothetical protein
MKHGQEKSDLFIVALKPTNKPGRPGAELVERWSQGRGPRGTRESNTRADTAPGKRVPEAQLRTNKLPVGFVR